jgi:hypothetical protein
MAAIPIVSKLPFGLGESTSQDPRRSTKQKTLSLRGCGEGGIRTHGRWPDRQAIISHPLLSHSSTSPQNTRIFCGCLQQALNVRAGLVNNALYPINEKLFARIDIAQVYVEVLGVFRHAAASHAAELYAGLESEL